MLALKLTRDNQIVINNTVIIRLAFKNEANYAKIVIEAPSDVYILREDNTQQDYRPVIK